MIRGDLPIGVLDSGIGGLSLVRALRRILPFEAITYLSDTARAPYGAKSAQSVLGFSLAAGAALAQHNPKLLVMACNTSSALALGALQAVAPCPVIGVIEPAAQAAAAAAGPLGLIASEATIASGAYQAAIHRCQPQAVLHALACPLLEALAETGWSDDPITDAICRRYLNQIPFEAHTVVLGSTQFGLLLPSLTRARPDTRWLDSAELTATAVEDLLRGGLGFRVASAQGALRLLFTDTAEPQLAAARRFLGGDLGTVERISL